MIARKLPSLNALRAFEASARHESFTLAAQELCVTQGAVSHQVKSLESELGVILFERQSNQLRLSAVGSRYLCVIGDALDRIEAGTRHLRQGQDKKTLVISASPNFAAKWLVARLGQFSALHPAQNIRLDLSSHHSDFATEEISLAIRYGEGAWPGLHSIQLGSEFFVPVCAPSITNADAQFDQYPLLHVEDRNTWKEWFARYEQARNSSTRDIVFNQESAAIDAAVAGQGTALARATLVVHDLMQQRLHVPRFCILPSHQSYWLVYPKSSHTIANVTAFRQWLLQAFETDRQFWNDIFMPLAPPH